MSTSRSDIAGDAAGSRRCAELIRAYWGHRGYPRIAADAQFAEMQFVNPFTGGISASHFWTVRSNLGPNGLPPAGDS